MTNETIMETLKVQPLSEEEKQARHILKRLTGPIASCKEGTRNGRKYNRELWEKALNDDIFKEKIDTKSLFLELGHPDRDETDMNCACACIPEMPKIIDGDLYAVVDVLDTPVGRLLNTLIDYGFQPGISSRGTGDVIEGYDGESEVDPETFFLETWDIVQTPALKKARLAVTEGLEKEKADLNVALRESLESSSEEDKKMMTEALRNVGIDVVEEEKVSDAVEAEDIKESESEGSEKESKEAVDDGTDALIRGLQEALKAKAELEATVKSLRESLAVSDAKVGKLEEENGRCKGTIVRLTKLSEGSKESAKRIASLEEELKRKTESINMLTKVTAESKARMDDENRSLRESAKRGSDELGRLRRELKESKEANEQKVRSLEESARKAGARSAKEIAELKSRLDKSSKLAEGYRKMANETMSSLISTKAVQLGVSENDITSRLGESYTLQDVEDVCESLSEYSLNLSRLPFRLDGNATVRIKESKMPTAKPNPSYYDDDIDEHSLRIAGLD